jgi:hypothetical protein
MNPVLRELREGPEDFLRAYAGIIGGHPNREA